MLIRQYLPYCGFGIRYSAVQLGVISFMSNALNERVTSSTEVTAVYGASALMANVANTADCHAIFCDSDLV